MFIAISKSAPGQPCTVRLDGYLLPFGSRAQVEEFVSILRKRIAAPHTFPPLPMPGQPSDADAERGRLPTRRTAAGFTI